MSYEITYQLDTFGSLAFGNVALFVEYMISDAMQNFWTTRSIPPQEPPIAWLRLAIQHCVDHTNIHRCSARRLEVKRGLLHRHERGPLHITLIAGGIISARRVLARRHPDENDHEQHMLRACISLSPS